MPMSAKKCFPVCRRSYDCGIPSEIFFAADASLAEHQTSSSPQYGMVQFADVRAKLQMSSSCRCHCAGILFCRH